MELRAAGMTPYELTEPYDNDKGPRKRQGAKVAYDYFDLRAEKEPGLAMPASPERKSPKKSSWDSARYLLLLLLPVVGIYHFGTRPVNDGLTRAVEYSLDAAQTLPGLQHLASANRYDYRASADSFDFCPPCSSGDSQCDRLGQGILSRSKLGVGSSHRVDHALRNAMDGRGSKIAVLGGSTAACKGIDTRAEHPKGNPLSASCFPAQTFSWWNATFPHMQNEMANGAPADVSYYAYCNAKHVQDNVDLIIVETLTTIQDLSQGLQTYEFFETFFRSLLLLPSQPAVVIVGGFSPQWHIDRVREHQMRDIQGMVRELAAYYDIPYISLGAAIQPAYAANHDLVIERYFQRDLHSPSKEGHGLIADLITHFFQARICALMDANVAEDIVGQPVRSVTRSLKNMIFEPGLLQTFAPGAVPPRLALSVPQDDKPFRELKPFCSIAGDLINPITPHIADGWTAFAPYSWDDPQCWQARTPGSRIRVDVQISSGRVAVRYERGPSLGDALCWVDDNEAGAKRIVGYDTIGHEEPSTFFVDELVSEGKHHVVCEIPSETTNPNKKLTLFKLVGVMTT